MPLIVHGNVHTVDALADAGAINIKRGEAIWFKQNILSPGCYIDNRKLMSHPTIWDVILGDLRNLIQRLARQYTDVVIASVATGGDPHAAVLAWRLALPLVSVRTQEKGHGGQAGFISGDQEVIKGAKVLLFEDTSSTFQSCLNAIQTIEMSGGHVVESILIATWSLPSFKLNTTAHRVHALCTGKMALDRLIELGRVDVQHGEVVRYWLDHPHDSSWADSSWKIPIRK